MKEMFFLPSVGWVGKNAANKFIFIIRFIPAFFYTVFLIKREKICAIFHSGAFASLPVGLAGIFLGIPIFTLVLDSRPGKAVNLLSRFSAEVFLPYTGDFSFIGGKKKVVTGIPVRESLLRGRYKEAIDYFSLESGKKTLLVIGGSRGAKFLAGLAEKLIPLMKKDWQFIVQRGNFEISSEFDLFRQFSFIDRMDLAYAVSDVIISRAGALATAEIESLGVPAILIPYPFAFKDHQFFNAKRLAFEKNNIIIMREEEAKVENFPNIIEALYGKKKKGIRNFSADRVVERILTYVRKI